MKILFIVWASLAMTASGAPDMELRQHITASLQKACKEADERAELTKWWQVPRRYRFEYQEEVDRSVYSGRDYVCVVMPLSEEELQEKSKEAAEKADEQF